MGRQVQSTGTGFPGGAGVTGSTRGGRPEWGGEGREEGGRGRRGRGKGEAEGRKGKEGRRRREGAGRRGGRGEGRGEKEVERRGGWVSRESGRWPRAAGGCVTRGGPAGVADEHVMKPGAWAPFVPGKPFKKPLPQPPCGARGDNGRRRSGPSGTPPLERPFQPRGPGSEARGAARPGLSPRARAALWGPRGHR